MLCFKSYWLGLRQICPTCPLEWVDVHPFNYENWQNGEPNGFGQETCVEMHTVDQWPNNPVSYSVLQSFLMANPLLPQFNLLNYRKQLLFVYWSLSNQELTVVAYLKKYSNLELYNLLYYKQF